MFGTRTSGTLLEYRMRLDVMNTTEILKTTYLPREIHGVRFPPTMAFYSSLSTLSCTCPIDFYDNSGGCRAFQLLVSLDRSNIVDRLTTRCTM